MIRRLTIKKAGATAEDLEFDAPRQLTIGETLSIAGMAAQAWFVGDQVLDLSKPVADLPDGVVLTDTPALPKRVGGLAMVVTGGAEIGSVHHLDEGGTVVGRSLSSGWVLDEPSVSRQHARIDVAGALCRVCDLGSSNGTSVNGVRLIADQPADIRPGDVVEVGNVALELLVGEGPRAELRKLESGRLLFNIQPRDRLQFEAVHVDAPAEVQEVDDFSSNAALASSITTLVGSVAMAVSLGRLQLLAIGLLAPLQFVVMNRLQRRRTHRLHSEKRAAQVASAEALTRRVSAADAAELAALRWSCPSAGEVLEVARGPGSRLWERQVDDSDFFAFRVGTAPQTATSTVRRSDGGVQRSVLNNCPVVASFVSYPVIGVFGSRPRAAGLARWIATQLAVFQSPDRLRISLLSSADREVDWSWMKWLPHTWQASGSTIAADTATSVEVLEQLVAAIDESIEDLGSRGVGSPRPGHLVIIDDVSRFAGEPALARLLSDGPLVGLCVLCVDSTRERLRAECSAVVSVDHEGSLAVTWMDFAEGRSGLAESLPIDLAETAARALCPVVPGQERRTSGPLPYPLSFEDLQPIPDGQSLSHRWSAVPASTTFTFGVSESGSMTLDLVADGPHFLVAGTAGSGKSETIQSMLAALALVNRPDSLSFALFDFKGGACFGSAVDLPHTTAKVVNLQGADGVRRALASISAELRWRQQRFAELSPPASSLAEYVSRRPDDMPLISRLVVVIDEYARFVSEVRAASDRITEIAQIGRSLGVHLLLGTQSPRGVVDAAIKANIQTKICLRTVDAAEASLVVDSVLPSRIPGKFRGRGYAVTPTGGLRAFQAAWLGAPLRGDVSAPRVRRLEFSRMNAAEPEAVAQAGPRQFESLCDAITEAWNLCGVGVNLRAPVAPELPELLELPVDAGSGRMALGLEDRVHLQDQRVFSIDPWAGAHVLVCGQAGSGRSTTVRTVALAAGQLAQPSHVHVIDLGSRRLSDLEALDHVGVVATEADPFRAAQLLDGLLEEARERDQLLASQRVMSVRNLKDPLPAVVLVIDNWSSFARQFERDRSVMSALSEVMAKGPATSITVVVLADHEIDTVFARSFPERLLLPFTDDAPYLRFGVDPRDVPAARNPGRALHLSSGNFVQIALPHARYQPSAQARGWLSLHPPLRLAELPTDVRLAELSSGAIRARAGLAMVLGLCAPRNEPLVFDLDREGPALLVTGAVGAGRSTLVRSVASQLRDQGVRLVFCGGRRSPLQHEGALFDWVVANQPGALADLQGELSLVEGPVVLVLDDVLSPVAEETVLSSFLSRPGLRGVIAGMAWGEARNLGTRSPFGMALREYPSVVVLNPDPDSALRDFQVSIPGALRLPKVPGRGLLFRAGSSVEFQAAH